MLWALPAAIAGERDRSELAPPTYWLSPSLDEAVEEWDYLRAWVDALLTRFGHLPPKVIPPCWYRHRGHVAALAFPTSLLRTLGAARRRSALAPGVARY